jgi:hypothetical protein
MRRLQYTLLADGPSDRCLTRIIDWVLEQVPEMARASFTMQVADFRMLKTPPTGLCDRIKQCLTCFPCDLLFIHRDAEKMLLENRIAEIERETRQANVNWHIPIVPVRMTEAWLLIDEAAIRAAAGNPNGKAPLGLPSVDQLERLADPKTVLKESLMGASGATGRRRARLERDINSRVHRVGGLIRDFSQLRQLPAFRAFEHETTRVVGSLMGER